MGGLDVKRKRRLGYFWNLYPSDRRRVGEMILIELGG
jgi:hypothetical protein